MSNFFSGIYCRQDSDCNDVKTPYCFDNQLESKCVGKINFNIIPIQCVRSKFVGKDFYISYTIFISSECKNDDHCSGYYFCKNNNCSKYSFPIWYLLKLMSIKLDFHNFSSLKHIC